MWLCARRLYAGAAATAAVAAAATAAAASRCDTSGGRSPQPCGERVLKRIVFVRHGQGHHHLGGGQGHLFDPSLTPQGEAEARAVFKDTSLADFTPTLALVSPLWRTLQTCTLAFQESWNTHGCTNVLATDAVREHNNQNACNHRRAIAAEHARAFPGIDFSLVDVEGPSPASEWMENNYKQAFGLLRARAARFLLELDVQSEEQVVVFTHGTFIRGVVSEILDLNAHHWGACPPTGTPVEVLRIEGVTGERYWELARPATVDKIGATAVPTAGLSAKRPGLTSPIVGG
jgi:broad specificity phosphatase PhoE